MSVAIRNHNVFFRSCPVKFPEVMSLGSRRGVAVALKSSKYNNEILRCSNKP